MKILIRLKNVENLHLPCKIYNFNCSYNWNSDNLLILTIVGELLLQEFYCDNNYKNNAIFYSKF